MHKSKINMLKSTNPLVSIIIITYNSSQYVLETLESAKKQTYENIELIISDDCSTDNSVTICKKWIEVNKNRFVNSLVIETEKNTGTPKNCNRGVFNAKGEYIKLIAGDDILLANCIKDNLEFIKGKSTQFLFSDMIFFNHTGVLSNYGNKKLVYFFSNKKKSDKLRSYLRTSLFLNSPTYFYSKELFEKIGGYDESFQVLEDNPFIARTLSAGCDIKFLSKPTVKYRIHNSSVTGSGNNRILNDLWKFHLKYVLPELSQGSINDKLFLRKAEFENWVKKNGYGRSFLFRTYRRLTNWVNYYS